MTIKIGQTVNINGEPKTIAKLTQGGLLVDTDGHEYDLWFDLVEAL